MAIPTETVTYDQLFSLTQRARRPRITDNYGDSQPLLDLLHGAGRVEIEDGGESIEEKLMYAYQDTEWMGDRQRVSTDDKEMVTTGVAPWRFIVAPINISKTDELKAAKSEMAAMDFAESKIVGARKGIRTGMNTGLCGQQSGKSILGLQDCIKDDPTTGTLLGINQADETWFRNKYYNSAVTFLSTTTEQIYDGWEKIGTYFEEASDVNDAVSHIFMGQTLYHKALVSLESPYYTRFVGGGRVSMGAGQGAGQSTGAGPMFRGAVLVKDRSIAASHIYGININMLKLKIMRGANFAKEPFVQTNATGVIGKVAFYITGCQLMPLNPRRTFVISNVS